MMGAGNANAAGTVASSNAWGAGIGGAANSVGSALMLNKLMKPPVNYSGGGGNGYGGNSATPYGGG
jgi:hypothetical protein